jgi:hypothetical protein
MCTAAIITQSGHSRGEDGRVQAPNMLCDQGARMSEREVYIMRTKVTVHHGKCVRSHRECANDEAVLTPFDVLHVTLS